MLRLFILTILFQYGTSSWYMNQQLLYPKKTLSPSETLDKVLVDQDTNIDIDKTIEALMILKIQRNETGNSTEMEFFLRNGQFATIDQVIDKILDKLTIRNEKARVVEQARKEKSDHEMNIVFAMLYGTIAAFFLGCFVLILCCQKCEKMMEERKKDRASRASRAAVDGASVRTAMTSLSVIP